MEVSQTLQALELAQDWPALAEALERAAGDEADATQKAAHYLKLGRILNEKLLQGPRALKVFQNAWKAEPSNLEPLHEARSVYWELGKLNTVETVLKRSLEASEGAVRAALLRELGDVSADIGNYDAAEQAYAQASELGDSEAAERRADLTDGDAVARIASLVELARAAGDVDERVALLLRAARLARRSAAAEYEPLLLEAYRASPANHEVAALYEELLVSEGKLQAVLDTQRQMLEHASETEGPALAFRFGSRWAVRHGNVELGAKLLEQALLGDPSNDAAFTFLRELWGTQGKDWDRVLGIATRLGDSEKATPFILSQAGRLCWHQVGDLMRAKQWFQRLAALAPSHPDIAAFEKQIGEKLAAATRPSAAPAARIEAKAVASAPPAAADDDDVAVDLGGDEVEVAEAAPEPVAPVSAPAVTSTPKPAEPEPPAEPAAADPDKVARLIADAEKYKNARKNHEYVKTLVELAQTVTDENEKVLYFSQAADVYQKFSNAAEAAKCFESILTIDRGHPEAIEFLRGYYEKRRDWEHLIELLRGEADLQPDPDLRLARYIEIAQLATQQVKKPQICIDLWQMVREQDPQNPDALTALSGFYERSREFDKLAEVLSAQAESTSDTAERLKILEKLGQIYGERINNDELAAEAWRQVLELSPGDRRAQENLKKKYLALKRWDDLEVLYEESGKWDEFIRVLESQETRETEPEVKIGLLLKCAELWEHKKEKVDRAARAYEKILSIDENHLGAAEALIPIYQAAGNAKGLASSIEVKLKHSTDPEEQLRLLREVAALYESKLKRLDLALERYLSALAIAPGDEECATEVERVARGTHNWDAAVKAYREALASLADPAAEGALRLRLGRVLLDEQKEVDQALEQYRAVYELDPENGDALGALERLYRETKRFGELLEVYEKQRDLATEPEQLRRVLYAIAALQETEQGDSLAAIKTYWQVLDAEAADAQALAALDRLYLAQQDWQPYADVLRRRLETDLDEATVIDLKYRLGQTLEQHLQDPAGALENYREILLLDPLNDGGRVALEGLLQQPELAPEIARILCEVYEGREEWEKLIGVLEILVTAEQEVEPRVALLRKIALTAAEQVNDLKRAFDAESRALADAPDNAQVRKELEMFAEQANDHARLAEVFSRIAEGLADQTLAREYWMRLAAIQQQLGEVDAGAKSYGRVLEIDPADAEALDAMEGLFGKNERWSDLIGVIRRRIDLEGDMQAREALYANMATVFEDKLHKPEEAIAAYREVLASDDTSLLALRALDGLYSRQKMFQELGENLEAQLRLAESEEAEIGLMLRLAALQETELNLRPSSIETYRQVLERQPQNPAALAALERLGKLPEHEVEIADILGPLYRASSDYQKLLGVYEVQVRTSDDPSRKVELLHEMAALHEDAAGDLNAGFDTFARALEVDASSTDTQQGLERLARATERFADLARVYRTLAAKQEDTELAISLYTTAASVYENELQSVDSAIELYRTILELDSQRLEAAEALERIFRGADRFEELSAILQRRAELLTDLDAQKTALMQAAQIEEEILERKENAVAVFRKVLEIDAEDVRALDALIKLYVGMARWADLLGAYNQKVELVLDPDERKRIYYQAGAVHERELGDVRNAIDTYQRVLEIDPDDLEALGRLDVLYQQAEDWSELLTVLQREADLAGDPAESISYQYRIAELYDKRLDDVARAIELYRDLLQQQPDHAPTLAALEALTETARDPVGAALVLEPIYDAAGEWAKLIRVLEVEVKHQEDVFQRVELLHRVARLYEEMLNDPQRAFDTYARAVQCDITNEQSLAQFERLAGMVSRWLELAALYDAELGKLAEDPQRFAELGLRVARIYEEQIENFDQAIQRFQRVLEIEPENATAIASLDRLYGHTERWAELAQILLREAELAASADEALQFRFRLALVRQTRLNDIDAAIQAYGEVLREMPEHAEALAALEGLFASGVQPTRVSEILEPHYESQSNFESLGRIFEATLAYRETREERLAHYYKLAELYEEKLIAPDLALGAFVRGLKDYPTDERCLEEVERLGGMCDGGWEQVANCYADILGSQEDKELQRMIGKRLARVFEEELADVTKAEETYRYVLGVIPLETDCLENLDRIYSSLEQSAELAGILEQRVQTTEDTFQLVEFYTRLGDVYEQRLAQYDDAIRAYRKIFDQLEPANEQAQQVLERLYTHKQAWPELLGVYERQIESSTVSDAERGDIAAKMGRLLSDHLGDLPRSIDTWKRVLDLRGEDGEALTALGDLYERTQAWAELTEILERHMGLPMEDREQVAVLLRRARLFSQQLGRDDAALDDYNRVLDIDYANVDALYAIADIWRRRQSSQDLCLALHQTVDRAGATLPAENLIALYRELGTIYQQVPDQAVDAIDAWRKLLAVDPRDFAAMVALEHLLRNESRWEEVVEVKMMRARAYEDSAEKIREYLEVADMWAHQIAHEDGATPALEAVLAIDPNHDDAFKQLEKLHAAASRSEQLVEMYMARFEMYTERPDAAQIIPQRTLLLRKVARVCDEQVNDQEQAYEALLTAFELDWSDKETTAYLEKMAHATKRWAQLVQIVQGWLEAEKEPLQQITLCLHLAKWYGEDLGRPDYAQPFYQKVIALDPTNVAAKLQMASFLKKNARWQEQGQQLTQALAVAALDSDRAVIQSELAEVYERHLNDLEGAITRYKQALEAVGTHLPALDALERIYEQKNQIPELVDILGRKSKALKDPEQIASVKLRQAGLLETTIGDAERAVEVYREVLDVDASSLLAMRGLERVYGAMQRWRELLEVLDMHLDVAATERERIDVLMQIARLQEEQFLKPDLAAVRLEQVVEIDTTHIGAYEALARCYQRLRQWRDLIGCYERHINATDDRAKKIELLWLIADVQATQLQDQERALDAYLNIIDIDPNHVPALEALSKLYERMDDPSNAIHYMGRVAELTDVGTQRVEAFYRIGKQLDEKLNDRVQARERYEQALDLDPKHLLTLAALRAIAIDEGDWPLAARYLEAEQGYTEAPRARAKLLVELGRLRRDMLDMPDQAVESFELAQQSDPDNEEAALPLLKEYVARSRWQEAEPLADMLVRKAGKREREEQLELHMLQGKVLAALGKNDPALRAYQAAHKLDLTNQEAIRGLAEVNFALGDWAGALTNYQKVLTSLGDDDHEQRAEVYYRLGCVKREQGQVKQAINNFEKGLQLVPTHRPTLEALVKVYEGLNDWAQACGYRRQILDNVIDGDERYALLNDLADIWQDKVGDPIQAIGCFEQAAELRPDDHQLLHKMLVLYQKTKTWDKVVQTIQRIAEGDAVPERRARYLFTMAQVYRDKLEDPYQAAELFSEALDLNPTYLDAFQRIDKIFTQLKDWNKLERAYRKMIHRVGGRGNNELEFKLWHSLGLIYRDRIGDKAHASEAFRMASTLNPEDQQVHVILAELAEQQGKFDEAQAGYRQLLKIDPTNADAYRALYAVYLQQQAYDPAWCCASVLAFIGKANEEEQRFYDDWKPEDMPKPTGRLTPDLWYEHLFHEDEDMYIGKIFEQIAWAALKAKIEDLTAKKQLPVLPDQYRQDPASSTQTFARTFWWAAEVLGIQPPQLFTRGDIPGGLAAVAASPPATVAASGVLTGISPLERAFFVGRHLAMYRAEHYIKNLFPTVTELQILLFAALQIAVPETPAPAEIAAHVRATAQQLIKHVQPIQREHLRAAVKKFLDAGARSNLKRWTQCVETTAARAGLLLCGDLEVARRVIEAQPALPGDLTPQERIRELMTWVASDSYAYLRQSLGMAIKPEG
ncbi:MAG: tetratricopeptide repeat protein [Myxococcales bacterium]|nr:tetratricopeptide repeat protein [Myxococcales bacterium]